MSGNVIIFHALFLFTVTCSPVTGVVLNLCESTCFPKVSDKDNGGCVFTTETSATDCSDWFLQSNITNGTLGDISLDLFSSTSDLDSPKANGLNVTFSNIKFNYLQLQYKEISDAKATCHVFNVSYQSVGGMSHNCLWPKSVVGAEMELKYQVYDSKTTAVDEGHYIFRVPNPNRIEPETTLLKDWEFFIYIDISHTSHVTVRWATPPSHFNVQYYLLKFMHAKGETWVKQIESYRLPVSKGAEEEVHEIATDALVGKFYVSVEILHENCTSRVCYVSKSPKFSLGSRFKSPLIIAAIGIFIMLPGFLYVFHSWRRFGALPPHKVPVILIIYKRTMDTHFRVIVALVMYLRKFCHVRALIEDFDILSADTQDSTSWYRDAFSRVDAVMVVSSPHHMESDKEMAYFNVNPAALSILAEKSCDVECSLKLFSVILPYCSDSDLPKEAENLPKFRLPHHLNSMLWFIRFGYRKSCLSRLEFYLFQSQIIGGACDYARCGKFLKDALVEANEESRRLWAMLTEAQ